jgi:Sap, sulfolipid-1-addressing protein
LLDLLPLAIGSAVYPTLLAMVVLILQRPDPRRILAAYLAGAMVTSLTFGFVVVAALRAGKVVGGSDRTLGPGVDVAVGLIALLLLWVLLTERDRPIRERRRVKKEAKADDGEDPWSERLLARNSLVLTFIVGMALNLPGALYLVALKDIAASDQGTGADVLQIVLYNVIMFQWAEIPLIGYAISPDGTRALVARMHSWLGTHARQIAIALCGAAAAFLITSGLVAAIG